MCSRVPVPNDLVIYLFIYLFLFKQLVSRHNVNRTKNHTEESQARISHAIYTKCLLNKNVFKLRLNEARVNNGVTFVNYYFICLLT